MLVYFFQSFEEQLDSDKSIFSAKHVIMNNKQPQDLKIMLWVFLFIIT